VRHSSELPHRDPPQPIPGGCSSWWPDEAMVKETKFFRKQADKAERMARSASDVEIAQNFENMARGYRAQAEVLKAKKKAEKKRH
jgi:hypothetical protein